MSMRIAGREIGRGKRPYVIAEIGVNHDGDEYRAIRLTELAAEAGAEAVKYQFFTADALMSKAARLATYQKAAGESDPLAMLRRLELPAAAMARAIDAAKRVGVHAIVSVFSIEHVPIVTSLEPDAIKVASPDLVNKPLLDAIARTGLPMIVSCGAATLEEVLRARQWLGEAAGRLAMLQCVSSYPTPLGVHGLGGLEDMLARLDVPVGYSDHTESQEMGMHAVIAGACVLEKHFTDDRGRSGPDHRASLDPGGFARYAKLARIAQLGVAPEDIELFNAPPEPPAKVVLPCEADVRQVSRQSLVAVRDLPAGHPIREGDLTIKRPGTGIEPWRLDEIIGRTTSRAVQADMPLTEQDLSGVSSRLVA